jgi:hypothetical protein
MSPLIKMDQDNHHEEVLWTEVDFRVVDQRGPRKPLSVHESMESACNALTVLKNASVFSLTTTKYVVTTTRWANITSDCKRRVIGPDAVDIDLARMSLSAPEDGHTKRRSPDDFEPAPTRGSRP